MAGKKGGNTVTKVYEIAKPIADELGLIIWNIEFVKEGALWFLRVFIDKEEDFLDMTDCENMTKPLNKALDEADPIEQNYILEVGSPGLARELKTKEHFEMYIDCPIRVRYIREMDGLKEFIAIIRAYNSKNSISVETENGIIDLNPSDTAFIKLYDDEDLFDDED